MAPDAATLPGDALAVTAVLTKAAVAAQPVGTDTAAAPGVVSALPATFVTAHPAARASAGAQAAAMVLLAAAAMARLATGAIVLAPVTATAATTGPEARPEPS